MSDLYVVEVEVVGARRSDEAVLGADVGARVAEEPGVGRDIRDAAQQAPVDVAGVRAAADAEDGAGATDLDDDEGVDGDGRGDACDTPRKPLMLFRNRAGATPPAPATPADRARTEGSEMVAALAGTLSNIGRKSYALPDCVP